ncbi:hypothetical protein HanLR1_Chr13g0471801 [Helianthus annuus]|nr:hypothetical protein HanLR1_Chr13g0471801 [Helianthus annuus]
MSVLLSTPASPSFSQSPQNTQPHPHSHPHYLSYAYNPLTCTVRHQSPETPPTTRRRLSFRRYPHQKTQTHL